MEFFNTLVNDTKKTVDYLTNMNLAYAEVACPQLQCDIATMQGRPSPSDEAVNSRDLAPAGSGYRCPPIPDAQSMADLNVGMAQLQSAITHGDMIQLGQAEMQAASATFDKVITDLGNAAQQQIP